MKHDEHCPACGKFVQAEPDGFYGNEVPDDCESQVRIFCDEKCWDAYEAIQPPKRPVDKLDPDAATSWPRNLEPEEAANG